MQTDRLSQLKKMLEAEPDDAFLNHALGMEFIGAGKTEEAVVVFENLLSRNEQYLASYYQLGQALEKCGREQEAVVVYRKGIELAKQQKNNKALGELNEALWMLEDE